jgi:hypothetical protein
MQWLSSASRAKRMHREEFFFAALKESLERANTSLKLISLSYWGLLRSAVKHL